MNEILPPFLTILKQLISDHGEVKSAFLTRGVIEDVTAFSLSDDDFFDSNIIGKHLLLDIKCYLDDGVFLPDERTFNLIYVLWSFIDAYSDQETRELVLAAVINEESYQNFRKYLQGMRTAE